MKDDGSIEKYGINAVCTHLGCVVPWNKAENKFKCPCHGSQYNNEGKVIRGPAPLSLALAHAEINDSDVITSPPGPNGLPHRPPALVEVSRPRESSNEEREMDDEARASDSFPTMFDRDERWRSISGCGARGGATPPRGSSMV